MPQRLTVCLLLASLAMARYTVADTAPPISRVWLTHQTNDPSHIVVSWLSEKPGDSLVQFGLTEEYGQTVRIDGHATLHHVCHVPSRPSNSVSCTQSLTLSRTAGGLKDD